MTVVLIATMTVAAVLPLTGGYAVASGESSDFDAIQGFMQYIHVNTYRFDPLADPPEIPSELRHGQVMAGEPNYAIVQFDRPVTESMKRGLEGNGAEILHYVPYNAFIVRVDGPSLELVREAPQVRWAGPFEPAYKLSPRLSEAYDELFERFVEMNRQGTATAIDSLSIGRSYSLSTSRADLRSLSASQEPLGADGLIPLIPSSLSRQDLAAVQGLKPVTTGPSLRIRIEVIAFESSGVPSVVRAISSMGGSEITWTSGKPGVVRAEFERATLWQLARVPEVMWIDRHVQPIAFNDIARWVVQSGDDATFRTPVHDQGIFGTGQTVTVGDTGIDFDHDAFEDPSMASPGPGHRKVTDYYIPTNASGDAQDNGINHGTHVSGSVAGDNGVWHVYDGDPTGSNGTAGPHDGQAFDASLQVQDMSPDGFFIFPPADVHEMYQDALNRNSWIHTNSWGSCCGAYIQEASDTDDFVWDNPEFVVLYAAGNSGSSLDTMNPYAGAKNAIAVGATANGLTHENIAGFSSRGPTDDGRLKPDVMAPGVGLWSARGCDSGPACDDYVRLSGTSMATPTVAGSAALVRQYYMDGWYPTGASRVIDAMTPSAALVKATLINGAAEMTGTGAYLNGENRYPNFNQGWGRVLLDDGLYFRDDARKLFVDDDRVGLSTSGTRIYQVAIGDPSIPMEVTLVWSDYAGVPLSLVNLVNDLDLVVTAPDGTTYRGNNYTGYSPGQSYRNGGPGAADHLNNVESVLVLSGQSGMWTVEVNGFNVPSGPQPFALAVTGGIATSLGVVSFDREQYRSSDTPSIKVIDRDLNVNPAAPDTATVSLTSSTETVPETVTVTETGSSTYLFLGSIPLATSPTPTPGDGILQVQDRDTITVEYLDADDGLGGSGPVYDTALIDDTRPTISGVRVTNIRFNRATVIWTTDEPSDSLVRYGTSTPPSLMAFDARGVTSHSVKLRGLSESTSYFFAVESTDPAGNTATDDNGTSYYRFRTPAKPPDEPPNDEWPTFHNNRRRLGVSPSLHTPPLSEQWRFGPNVYQFYTGPVLSDGVLFSTTLDGYIRAREPYTGTVLWERALGDLYYYTPTPTVNDGVVYVTFYGAAGGFVYALDASTGDTIWVVGPGSGIDFNARVPLAVVDGLVFGAAWSGEIFAMHAENGSIVWTFQTSDMPFGGPTIGAYQLVMGTVGGVVLALDLLTGEQLWRFEADGIVTGAPLYASGRAYFGTWAGTLYALDWLTGAEAWNTSVTGALTFMTPTTDGARIFFASDSYYAADAATGGILWSNPTPISVTGSVAYANGYVYGADNDGMLRTLDATTGSIVDEEPLANVAQCQPAISDGWVWVEDIDGRIYGFQGTLSVGLIVYPSTQRKDATPNSQVDYVVTARNIGVSGPDTFDVTYVPGALSWTVSFFESDLVTPLPDTDGDLVPDTGALASGATKDVVVRVTVPPSAAAGDEETSTATFTSSTNTSRSKSARVVTTVPPPGLDLGHTIGLEKAPGDVVSVPVSALNTGGLADTFDIVTSSSQGWSVELFQSDGMTPLPDTDGDSVPDTGLVPGLTPASFIVRINVPTGATLGTVDRTLVTGNSSAAPSVSDTLAILIELLEPPSPEWPQFHHDRERSGVAPVPYPLPLTWRWTTATGNPIVLSSPVVQDHTVYATNTGGDLLALDIGSGAIDWRVTLGDPGPYAGTPLAAYGTIYVALVTNGSEITLFALDPTDGNVLWRDTSNAGVGPIATTTPAGAAGMVYWSDWSGRSVHANDATTGARLWTQRLSGYVALGPTYAAGIVYSGDFDGSIVAMDAFTGDVLWSRRLGAQIGAAPTVSSGVLYVGDSDGTLHAMNATTGAPLWTALGLSLSLIVSSPAVAQGLAYIGGVGFNVSDGQMVAVDSATGAVRWFDVIPGAIQASPAYNNGTVFAAATDGTLYAWDALSGARVQTLPVSSVLITSSVAVADGYVIVADEGGALTGFGFVGAGEVDRIEVTPDPLDVVVTGAGWLEARALDSFGNDVPNQTFMWSVPSLGTLFPVTPSGDRAVYVAGATAGVDTIMATSPPFSDNATANVLPGPLDRVTVTPSTASVAVTGTLAFSAEATDRFGNLITGTNFTWAVTGGIGTIDAAGLFTAGTTVSMGTVTASSGGKMGVATVEVVPGSIASIQVTPDPIDIEAGTFRVLQAQGYDSYGNAVSSLTYVWSSTIGTVTPTSASGEAAVLSAGFVAGAGTLTVTSGGVTRPVSVSAQPGPLNRIAVSPDPASVIAGGTLTFSAAPMDMFGNAIGGLIVTWTAGLNVGTISSGGVLTAATAVATGTVTASIGVVSQMVSVTIIPGPLSVISVTPTSLTASAGSSTTLIASGADQYGNQVVATISWSSTAGMVTPLNLLGTVASYDAPTTVGSATVTASSGAISKVVGVTITPGPVAFVVITPATATIARGGTVAFTAEARDLYGNLVTGAAVIWSASAGSISANGTLTAPGTSGTVTVTASIAGRQSQAVVVVTSDEPIDGADRVDVSWWPLVPTIVLAVLLAFLYLRYRQLRQRLDGQGMNQKGLPAPAEEEGTTEKGEEGERG